MSSLDDPLTPGAIEAPAKINLTLEILERRDDGYHGLRSVMVPIGLYDRITWKAADRFRLITDDPRLTSDNLIERAFRAIGRGEIRLEITLRKAIPVGGGLGGGSSDAAAILRAAMSGAFGALAGRDWVATARALGSDVPFFLVEGPALVEGTGERVTALGAPPPWWLCIVVPRASVDTGEAYRRLDASRGRLARTARSQSVSLRLGEALQRADFAATQALMQNDFEEIIVGAYPAIAQALEALRAAGAERPMLSGSGACVFALCETEAAAREIERRLGGEWRAAVVPLARTAVWAGGR
jgi:4-diphosphocytidyl-2-C-methyl-D-erythritol kinase